MNHLAHFLLAGSETGLIVGGFLGDFVKGRLPVEDNQGRSGDSLNAALAGLEHGIVRGIRLHRAIDGYTDSHTIVKQSQRRFSTPLRRFAPLLPTLSITISWLVTGQGFTPPASASLLQRFAGWC